MKSLLLKEYLQLELADFPQPQPGPGEVLIRVAACGICGSDVHGFDGTSGRRIPPIVMGHEAAGVVAAVGAGVHAVQARRPRHLRLHRLLRRVRLLPPRRSESVRPPRGHRRLLRRLPPPRRIRRVHRRSRAHPLPSARSDVVSRRPPCSRPSRSRLHAVRVSELHEGQTALVIGAGMIGLLTMQAARAAGAARVFIADIDATRLNLATLAGRR